MEILSAFHQPRSNYRNRVQTAAAIGNNIYKRGVFYADAKENKALYIFFTGLFTSSDHSCNPSATPKRLRSDPLLKYYNLKRESNQRPEWRRAGPRSRARTEVWGTGAALLAAPHRSSALCIHREPPLVGLKMRRHQSPLLNKDTKTWKDLGPLYAEVFWCKRMLMGSDELQLCSSASVGSTFCAVLTTNYLNPLNVPTLSYAFYSSAVREKAQSCLINIWS